MPSKTVISIATGVLAILSFTGTMAAILVKQPFMHPSQTQAQEDHARTPSAPLLGPSWDFQSEEVDQLVEELKKERKILKEKEEQLNELSRRIQAERLELNSATQVVANLQAQFDASVTRLKEEEKSNLKRLAKVYSAMSPEGAANILKEMDDDQLVKILLLMKESQTGPILEALGREKPIATMAKRAAAISDRLRLVSNQAPTP